MTNANIFPQSLLDQWHPNLNNILKLKNFTLGSHTKVWWKCEKGHEWQAPIRNRVNGSRCSYCSNLKVLAGYNDFESRYPDLSKEWHPTKNQTLKPNAIVYGSNKKVWWMCNVGHEWVAAVGDRVVYSAPCPYCSGQKVLTGFNDLTITHTKLTSEWHPTKNLNVFPNKVSYGSHAKVWWVCAIGHEWEAVVNSRHQGRGCPFCSNTLVLNGFNDFTTVFPELRKEWHPTKNKLDPSKLLPGASKIVWWLGKCGHEWEATLVSRTFSGHSCIYCSNSKVLEGFNDFQTCYPKVAAEWHATKNIVKPTHLAKSSNKIVWWLGKCGHEWEAAISGRTIQNNGCPICSSHRLLTGYNDLETLFSTIATEWHPTKNGMLKPNQVSSKTDTVVWWLGKCGHEWKMKVGARTGRFSGCTKCANNVSRPENIIYEYIVGFILDAEQSNRKLLKGKELDIYIPSLNLAIEFNGIYWHNEAKGKGGNYHYDKWLACKSLGINLLYIWEDDWMADSEAILRDIDILLEIKTREQALAAIRVLPLTIQDSESKLPNGSLRSILHTLSGYKVVEEIAPSFSYVVKSKRVDKLELNDADLAKIDDLARIWDAGKSIWTLE